jgi:hypothetical protein
VVPGVDISVVKLASACEILLYAFCIALKLVPSYEAPVLKAMLFSHRLAKAHPVKPVPIENL